MSRRRKPAHSSILFRFLLESAQDYAIFTTDMKGIVTSWNAGAERMSGYSAAEAVGRNSELIFIPEDRERREPQKELNSARTDGFAINERWHLRRDGTRFWGSGVVRPLMNARGRQIGYVKIMRDITERKRMADQLARKSDELEQFCHVAAHDLQSPINKVRSFAELLKEKAGGRLDESVRGYVDRIIDASNRMTALINDLLNFAKTTDPEGQFEPVDLNDVVSGVVSDLEVPILEKRAQVRVGSLPVVHAHGAQMYQLFLNLISNAIKFSKKDVPPVVTVKSERGDGFWRITVRDNGIGFNTAEAERIFKPFTRLHSYQKYEGTGIGLARCRKIVEFHAGTITAEGRPGQGATFIITLPFLS